MDVGGERREGKHLCLFSLGWWRVPKMEKESTSVVESASEARIVRGRWHFIFAKLGGSDDLRRAWQYNNWEHDEMRRWFSILVGTLSDLCKCPSIRFAIV